MSWEVCWDETWERVHTGYYINSKGYEIVRIGTVSWVLITGRRADTKHRTLKAAKAAADKI